MDENLKFLFAETKGIGADGLLEAAASTAALDRDGEVIEPDAWRASLKRYRSNPVILSTHQHRLPSGSSPVIGSARSIDVVDGALVFKMAFAGTALGKEFEQLFRERHMRAFSVGFLPKKAESKSVGGRKVLHHTEVELLEISAVPVPSNPEALARMRAAAFAAGPAIDEKAAKDLVDAVVKAVQAEIENLKSKIDEVATLVASLVPDPVNPPAFGSEAPDPDDAGADARGAGDGALVAAARSLRETCMH